MIARRTAQHRTGPAIVAVALVASLGLAFTPRAASGGQTAPGAAPAADASADPSASPDPSLPASPDPSSSPAPSPSTDPSAAPDPSPSPSAAPSPSIDPGPTPTVDPGPLPSPEPSPSAAPSTTPAASPTPAAGPAVDLVRFARVDDLTLVASPLGDSPTAAAVRRFDVIRVRFRVTNAGDIPATFSPVLELGDGTSGLAPVPAGKAQRGVPLYAAREWVAGTGAGRGTALGPTTSILAPAAFDMPAPADPLTAVPGIRVMGENPGPSVALAARAWTVVEFTIRTTVDADFLATYRVRLAADGLTADAAAVGALRMDDAPAVPVSPRQLTGIPADPDGAITDVLRYRLSAADGGFAATAARFVSGAAGRLEYPLVAAASSRLAPTVPGQPVAAGAFISPHGGYTATPAACAACHRAHSSGIGNLVAGTVTQATVCLTCHNGTGANADVAATYGNPAVPANDPATAAWYSHDALSASNHLSAQENEFQSASGTPILNRHSECGDCHDPHRSNGTPATMTAGGWTAPSPLEGISGVAVVNGAAGSAPTYSAWTSSSTVHETTLEYELCLKCHSGFTQLRPQTAGAASTWALDKGIELNPANASTHPVEGAGSNGTAPMAASLAGTSPYKQWNYLVTDSVRCVNCHADPSKFSATNPPAAGSDLAPHASVNRGILFQPYTDRTLKGSADDYAATDFALCYVCHAEAPFRDTSGDPRPDTGFQYHGLHVSGIQNKGSGGTSIDQGGDGQGNAICAECHFRIHSTALAYRIEDRSNQRLVNFAPNVVASGTAWSSTGIASGTCTLTCHGEPHAESYGPINDELILAVVASPTTYRAAGESIVFRYVITNATAGTITGPVTLTDPLVGAVSCPTGDLAVGATLTCVGTYSTTGADVLLGSVTTSAHADTAVAHSNVSGVTLRLAP